VSETNDAIFVEIKISIMSLVKSQGRRFANLVLDIKFALKQNLVSLSDMQFLLQEHCELEPLSTEAPTLECFFSRMRQHYCFLNYWCLECLVDRFLCNNKPLQQKFQAYSKRLENFKMSVELKFLMKFIEEKRDLYGGHNVVEMKLHSFWGEITLKRFERCTKVVYEETYQHLVHISVTKGCLCASWIIPKLIPVKPRSHDFMRILGIISSRNAMQVAILTSYVNSCCSIF